jgi:hypothetical protein
MPNPKSLALTLSLLFCPVAPAFSFSFPHEDIRPYQQPTVVQKVRIKIPNNCYTYVERDFAERLYCKPDQFFLHLSDGEMRQVSEVQYNRNNIGQPLTR